MAKADLTLPDGTTVAIDGSPDEITKILRALGSPEPSATAANAPPAAPKAKKRRSTAAKPAGSRSATRKKGQTAQILALRDDGFFRGEQRTLKEIQDKLREQGHVYALDSLSPILLSLVRRRELRRLREGRRWTYTSS